jgi:hypothetical protein
MTRQLAILAIDEADLERGNVLAFEANYPARIVRVRARYAEKKRLIPRPRNKALDADDLTTKLTLYVEIDPDAPPVGRRALVIPLRAKVSVPDAARFADTFEDHHGAVLAVLELPRDDDPPFVRRDVKPENVPQRDREGGIDSGHNWRAPDSSLREALEESGVCDSCGVYASEAWKPCAAPAPEPDGACSPLALSGANDGGGPA